MEENKPVTGGEEKQNIPAWKRRWIASRMAFESILFERELLTEKKEKNYRGIILFSLIFIFQLFLLWLYFFRNGAAMSAMDVEKLKIAASYFSSFSGGGFMDLFRNTGISFIDFNMPLYYFTFLPVLKYLTSDYAWALFIVNSFYLFLLFLAVYLLISRKRIYESALLGVAVLTAMPFVSELARHFSPQIATMAFVSLTYLCFIRSEDFENPRWILPMAVSISCGLLSDLLFPVYVLTVLPWLNYGFAGIYRANVVKGLLPGLVLTIPFYIRIILKAGFLYLLHGREYRKTQGFNLFWYLSPVADAVQPLFFVLGAAAMIWMYYSLFMPYDKRKVVARWFLISYLVLWLLPFKSPEYIYPALIPFAVAIAIMTPHLIRKYVIGVALVLAILNQGGFLDRKTVIWRGGPVSILGMEKPPLKTEKLDEIMTLIRENITSGKDVVSVFGESKYINTRTLGFLASHYGISNARFVKFPEDMMLFADIVVVKGVENLNRFFSLFKDFFEEKVSFNNGDISVFKKKIPENYLPGKNPEFRIKSGSIAGISFTDAIIKASDFDQRRKVYGRADVFISWAGADELDANGIELGFEDFCLINYEGSPVFCGFSRVTLNSALITDYSAARFIEKKFSALKNVEVDFTGGINVFAVIRGNDFALESDLKSGGGELAFSIKKMEYKGYGLPDWMYRFMNFTIRESEMIIPVEVKSLIFKKRVLKVSPLEKWDRDSSDKDFDSSGKVSGGDSDPSRFKAGVKAIINKNRVFNAPVEDHDE